MLLRIAMVLAYCLLAASPGSAEESAPVGSWRFDHVGDRVVDASGRGHDAHLMGGSITSDASGAHLHGDGTQTLMAGSPDFDLCKGFTIEARIRPTDLKDGRNIVFKDHQYALRIDWPNEGSRLSFFVYGDGGWEPRVSAYMPAVGEWAHIVAQWDGHRSYLWLNGEPFTNSRGTEPPQPSNAHLLIGGACPLAAGFVGDIEYVRVYRRMLTTAEIIRTSYGIAATAGSRTSRSEFTFRDAQGWRAGAAARIELHAGGISVICPSARAHIAQTGLGLDVSKRDYLSLRMAVDRGSRGEIVFVTTKGAARIPFAVHADGRPHTYVIEPWEWPGWGGTLLALALAPTDTPGTTARLQYLRITGAVQAEPELEVTGVFTDSTLPRSGREETIIARFHNAGGPCEDLRARLSPPAGVVLRGAASQSLGALGYQAVKELRWQVTAARPLSGAFRVVCSAPDGSAERRVERAETIRFRPAVSRRHASYVPVPVPVKTGKYTLWTHYCPLWKQGTQIGWKAIEAWPNRKPVIGWYNEGDPEVADWHIKYWVEHGISGVVYCWYRANINGPVTQNLGHAIHDGLLKARYLPMIHFAIMWENGCGQGVGSRRDLLDNVLPFWMTNYFSKPSYLRVNGKPLIYIWVPQNVTRDLKSSEQVRATLNEMRAICRRKGLGGLYIVGCVGSQDRQTLETMAKEGWDASSAYGANWRQPAQVKTVGSFVCAPYEGFVSQQAQLWRYKRELHLLPDITAAMMGWDSRPWNETPFFWSENTPAKFRDLCLRAKANMDASDSPGPQKNTTIFCCWNEFGEGHYIEPTRGYGFDYLDVIRDVFTQSHGPHTDLSPEDVGRAPRDSWYQRARRAAPAQNTTASAWSGSTLGAWSGMMGLEGIAVRKGVLRARSSNGDPAFSSPALRLRANRCGSVIVEMRVSRPGRAQLFWATAASPSWTEAASVLTPTIADGQFHAYRFDVEKNEQWGGCVTALRFDPCEETGTLIEVRSIRIAPPATP